MTYFITVEGIEGVGKSTACETIEAWFKEQKIPYCRTREPGGTIVGERIRAILLDPTIDPLSNETELLLLFASRAQHLSEVIRPALQSKQWVLSDRFTDASYAYQGGGREIEAEKIQTLEAWLHDDLQPDVTFLLDAPIEVALKRMQERGELDRIEAEHVDFFQRVRKQYLLRAINHFGRFRVIDANQPLSVVQENIIHDLNSLRQ